MCSPNNDDSLYICENLIDKADCLFVDGCTYIDSVKGAEMCYSTDYYNYASKGVWWAMLTDSECELFEGCAYWYVDEEVCIPTYWWGRDECELGLPAAYTTDLTCSK